MSLPLNASIVTYRDDLVFYTNNGEEEDDGWSVGYIDVSELRFTPYDKRGAVS